MKGLKEIMSLAMLLSIGITTAMAQTSNQSVTVNNNETMKNNNEKVTAILNAVELYAEAGRKGSREIGEKVFTKEATMSWVENGKITTVPITALFEGLEATGEEDVTYNVVDVNIAGNVAFVRIESTFSKLGSYDDMFTLAEQGDEWKIVSKIYHTR